LSKSPADEAGFFVYAAFRFPSFASVAEIFRRVLRFTAPFGSAVFLTYYEIAYTRRNSLHTTAEKFLMLLQQKPEILYRKYY